MINKFIGRKDVKNIVFHHMEGSKTLVDSYVTRCMHKFLSSAGERRGEEERREDLEMSALTALSCHQSSNEAISHNLSVENIYFSTYESCLLRLYV